MVNRRSDTDLMVNRRSDTDLGNTQSAPREPAAGFFFSLVFGHTPAPPGAPGCAAWGSGVILPPCAQLLWCELYVMKSIKKKKKEWHRAELELRFLPVLYRRPLNRVGTLSACAVCVARRVCVFAL